MNDSLRLKIYERDMGICSCCGDETRFFNSSYDHPFRDGPKAGSVDHIIPVSKGGTNEESNLRWMCRACNCSRGNRYHAIPETEKRHIREEKKVHDFEKIKSLLKPKTIKP